LEVPADLHELVIPSLVTLMISVTNDGISDRSIIQHLFIVLLCTASYDTYKVFIRNVLLFIV